jgi:hypothetical protein
MPTVAALIGCTSATQGAMSTAYQRDADMAAFRAYPQIYAQIARASLPTDQGGLIGPNRQWGAMYSPRFQLGAGQGLRFAISTNAIPQATLAFHGIRASAAVIRNDGYVPSSLPTDLFPDAKPSPTDIASGAAFFLGDACLGMMALESSPDANTIIPADVRRTVKDKLVRAIRWLAPQRQTLEDEDRRAPNRLFFDALAFHACGTLGADSDSRRLADRFVTLALASMTSQGYFTEGGGWDTTYQSVSIRVANDLIVAGYVRDGLQPTIAKATTWLALRVDAQGRVDSSGNTRTCGGGESFLGKKKLLSPAAVFMALAFTGTRENDPNALRAAERVAAWASQTPEPDPCYP